MQQQQRQMPTSQLLKRFIPYFYKYRKLLVIDLMAAGLTTVCELVLPLIVRRITNGALGMAGELSTGLILRLGALYMLLRVIDASANYYMQSEGHVMGARIETDMRTDLFAHLQQLSLATTTTPKSARSWAASPATCLILPSLRTTAPKTFSFRASRC